MEAANRIHRARACMLGGMPEETLLVAEPVLQLSNATSLVLEAAPCSRDSREPEEALSVALRPGCHAVPALFRPVDADLPDDSAEEVYHIALREAEATGVGDGAAADMAGPWSGTLSVTHTLAKAGASAAMMVCLGAGSEAQQAVIRVDLKILPGSSTISVELRMERDLTTSLEDSIAAGKHAVAAGKDSIAAGKHAVAAAATASSVGARQEGSGSASAGPDALGRCDSEGSADDAEDAAAAAAALLTTRPPLIVVENHSSAALFLWQGDESSASGVEASPAAWKSKSLLSRAQQQSFAYRQALDIEYHSSEAGRAAAATEDRSWIDKSSWVDPRQSRQWGWRTPAMSTAVSAKVSIRGAWLRELRGSSGTDASLGAAVISQPPRDVMASDVVDLDLRAADVPGHRGWFGCVAKPADVSANTGSGSLLVMQVLPRGTTTVVRVREVAASSEEGIRSLETRKLLSAADQGIAGAVIGVFGGQASGEAAIAKARQMAIKAESEYDASAAGGFASDTKEEDDDPSAVASPGESDSPADPGTELDGADADATDTLVLIDEPWDPDERRKVIQGLMRGLTTAFVVQVPGLELTLSQAGLERGVVHVSRLALKANRSAAKADVDLTIGSVQVDTFADQAPLQKPQPSVVLFCRDETRQKTARDAAGSDPERQPHLCVGMHVVLRDHVIDIGGLEVSLAPSAVDAQPRALIPTVDVIANIVLAATKSKTVKMMLAAGASSGHGPPRLAAGESFGSSFVVASSSSFSSSSLATSSTGPHQHGVLGAQTPSPMLAMLVSPGSADPFRPRGSLVQAASDAQRTSAVTRRLVNVDLFTMSPVALRVGFKFDTRLMRSLSRLQHAASGSVYRSNGGVVATVAGALAPVANALGALFASAGLVSVRLPQLVQTFRPATADEVVSVMVQHVVRYGPSVGMAASALMSSSAVGHVARSSRHVLQAMNSQGSNDDADSSRETNAQSQASRDKSAMFALASLSLGKAATVSLFPLSAVSVTGEASPPEAGRRAADAGDAGDSAASASPVNTAADAGGAGDSAASASPVNTAADAGDAGDSVGLPRADHQPGEEEEEDEGGADAGEAPGVPDGADAGEAPGVPDGAASEHGTKSQSAGSAGSAMTAIARKAGSAGSAGGKQLQKTALGAAAMFAFAGRRGLRMTSGVSRFAGEAVHMSLRSVSRGISTLAGQENAFAQQMDEVEHRERQETTASPHTALVDGRKAFLTSLRASGQEFLSRPVQGAIKGGVVGLVGGLASGTAAAVLLTTAGTVEGLGALTDAGSRAISAVLTGQRTRAQAEVAVAAVFVDACGCCEQLHGFRRQTAVVAILRSFEWRLSGVTADTIRKQQASVAAAQPAASAASPLRVDAAALVCKAPAAKATAERIVCERAVMPDPSWLKNRALGSAAAPRVSSQQVWVARQQVRWHLCRGYELVAWATGTAARVGAILSMPMGCHERISSDGGHLLEQRARRQSWGLSSVLLARSLLSELSVRCAVDLARERAVLPGKRMALAPIAGERVLLHCAAPITWMLGARGDRVTRPEPATPAKASAAIPAAQAPKASPFLTVDDTSMQSAAIAALRVCGIHDPTAAEVCLPNWNAPCVGFLTDETAVSFEGDAAETRAWFMDGQPVMARGSALRPVAQPAEHTESEAGAGVLTMTNRRLLAWRVDAPLGGAQSEVYDMQGNPVQSWTPHLLWCLDMGATRQGTAQANKFTEQLRLLASKASEASGDDSSCRTVPRHEPLTALLLAEMAAEELRSIGPRLPNKQSPKFAEGLRMGVAGFALTERTMWTAYRSSRPAIWALIRCLAGSHSGASIASAAGHGAGGSHAGASITSAAGHGAGGSVDGHGAGGSVDGHGAADARRMAGAAAGGAAAGASAGASMADDASPSVQCAWKLLHAAVSGQGSPNRDVVTLASTRACPSSVLVSLSVLWRVAPAVQGTMRLIVGAEWPQAAAELAELAELQPLAEPIQTLQVLQRADAKIDVLFAGDRNAENVPWMWAMMWLLAVPRHGAGIAMAAASMAFATGDRSRAEAGKMFEGSGLDAHDAEKVYGPALQGLVCAIAAAGQWADWA
jgi:hypothetical protein